MASERSSIPSESDRTSNFTTSSAYSNEGQQFSEGVVNTNEVNKFGQNSNSSETYNDNAKIRLFTQPLRVILMRLRRREIPIQLLREIVTKPSILTRIQALLELQMDLATINKMKINK